MEKRILLSVVVAGLLVLGIAEAVFAGVEPSPWEPEINKLHSIELNLAAIQKRLEKLQSPAPLPNGIANYFDATVNQLGVLDTRLADVISTLPDTFTPGLEEVILSLDGIRTDANGNMDLLENIYSRLGIEPSPWREVVGSIISRATFYIDSVCIIGGPAVCSPGH